MFREEVLRGTNFIKKGWVINTVKIKKNIQRKTGNTRLSENNSPS